MKKRILIMLMVISCLFSLTACHKDEEDKQPIVSDNPIVDDDGTDPEPSSPPVIRNETEFVEIGTLYDMNASFKIKVEGLEPEELTIIYPDASEHKVSYKQMEIQTGDGFFYIEPYEPLAGTYWAKYDAEIENVNFEVETTDPIVFIEIPEADKNHTKFNIIGMRYPTGEYWVEVVDDNQENNELNSYIVAMGTVNTDTFEVTHDIYLEPGEYSLYVYVSYPYNTEIKEVFNYVPITIELESYNEADIVDEPEV